MKGESSTIEECKLLDLLLETPQNQLSQDERTILELLTYSEQEEEEEEDIFAVDYSDEYDKVVKPIRTIRMWPWAAAACVAGVLTMFLMPPKTVNETVENSQIVAKVEPQATNTPTASLQTEETPMVETVNETIVAQKQSKATSEAATAVSQPIEESEPEEEPVLMSEETKMELLMAYLSPEEQMPREFDPEEEIRQMRMRGERMLSQMKTE